MSVYRPVCPEYPNADYDDIRHNGMWYERWQSGYADFLKAGHPQPADERTILAALYSPQTDDFLHGHGGDVPFLVSDRARRVLEGAHLTGFDFAPVEIVFANLQRFRLLNAIGMGDAGIVRECLEAGALRST